MKFSIKKDQRGLAPVMIVVVVVVLAAIGVVGWKMTQKDSVTKNATPAEKAAISACEKTLNDKDLCKFTGNYNLDKLPYKVVITSTGASAGTLTMLSDGKGNTQLTSAGAGASSFDSISLNGDTYLKGEDGTWVKYPKSSSSPTPAETNPTGNLKFDTSAAAIAASGITYKKIGKEACGSLTCIKYQVIDKATPGTTQFFWFDTKDYRMERYSTKDATSSTDMVITYQAVTIKAPTPVKDFSLSSTGADSAAAQAAAAAAAQSAANSGYTAPTDSGQ